MSRLLQMARCWTMCALGAFATTALAGGNANTASDDEQIAHLEAALAAQQNRIEQLQTKLAAGATRNQDAARVEAMKQQIREVLSEQEFRESLMPSTMQAGYDKGFYIKSSDDKFKLKVNGRIQFRWTHYNQQSRNRYLTPRLERDDRTGFDAERIRMTFSGHAWTPDFTYYIQFRMGAGTDYDTRLRDGYVDYRFCDGFHVRAGMFKIAATQSYLTSSANLQFVDRPMVDAVFSPSRGMGVRFWGQFFDKRAEYYLDVLNSLNSESNRTITNDPAELDGNPAIAFRAVWHALGDNPGKDLTSEADLEYHESPALDFAFHYLFNDDQYDLRTTRIPYPIPRRTYGVGGFGLTDTNGLQTNQFGLATAMKCHGFSARGEYILRIVDPRRAGRRPFAPWWLLTRQGDTTVMHGAYMQFGYFLPIPGLENKVEAVARAGGISTLANGKEGTWEYAAGVNYYMEGNGAKLQFDVTKVSEVPISSGSSSLANVNDQPLIFRVQLQIAF